MAGKASMLVYSCLFISYFLYTDDFSLVLSYLISWPYRLSSQTWALACFPCFFSLALLRLHYVVVFDPCGVYLSTR